jgi:hypothetical protein
MRLAYLAAALAHVRLFASVYTLVDCQRRTLDELLAAVGIIADVRPYAAVNAF